MSDAELKALEADVDDEMYGREDAEYLRQAGIDDTGHR